MFKFIKDNFKKSEASLIIESLLRKYIQLGLFETRLSESKIAIKMVEQAWSIKPDLLGGRFGTRPHKVTLALYSVATAIVSSGNAASEKSHDFQKICVMMFSDLINELEINGRLYSLTETDNFLCELALKIATPTIEDSDLFDSPEEAEELSSIFGFTDDQCRLESQLLLAINNCDYSKAHGAIVSGLKIQSPDFADKCKYLISKSEDKDMRNLINFFLKDNGYS